MKTFFRLLALFKPQIGWLALGIFLSLAATGAGIILMGISGWFLAAMGLAGVAGVSMNYFTPAAIIRGCAIIRTAGRYGERLVTHEATFRLLANIRSWMYSTLEPLAPAGLEGYHSGELFTRLRVDIDRLERFYLQFLVPVVVVFIVMAAVTLFCLSYSLPLGLLVGGLLLAGGLIFPLWHTYTGMQLERQDVLKTGDMRTHLATTFNSMAEAQVYGVTDHQHTWAALNEELVTTQQTGGIRLAFVEHLLPLLAMVTLAGVFVLMVPGLGQTGFTGPELPLLSLLVLVTFEALALLPGAFATLPSTLLSAERLFSLADTPVPPQTGTLTAVKGPLSLTFTDVIFRYGPQHPEVLKGVTLSLQQGKKVAILGHSGAGKSSLIQLINGFWAPTGGEIQLNGQPLNQYAPDALRAQFAVSPQNPHIFAVTLRENLTLGHPQATQAELEEACRCASIHDFIAQLPEGYDTYIGENGMRLSGGQRQRLSIARALLKPAPFLVLDEPLEGLDETTGRTMLTQVLTNYADRGLLLLTHQGTCLDRMDKVYALEEGTLTEVPRSRLKLYTG